MLSKQLKDNILLQKNNLNFEGYNSFRELCGLPRIESMMSAESPTYISNEKWSLLKQIYSTPDAIDLYVGGNLYKIKLFARINIYL